MSGSELMDEISKTTGGNWKPSPGSIYPMLSWLQDNQYIKELPTENGLKRYEITRPAKNCLKKKPKPERKCAKNSDSWLSLSLTEATVKFRGKNHCRYASP
jgi:DNA-binding PadR family transcriptional regulator